MTQRLHIRPDGLGHWRVIGEGMKFHSICKDLHQALLVASITKTTWYPNAQIVHLDDWRVLAGERRRQRLEQRDAMRSDWNEDL